MVFLTGADLLWLKGVEVQLSSWSFPHQKDLKKCKHHPYLWHFMAIEIGNMMISSNWSWGDTIFRQSHCLCPKIWGIPESHGLIWGEPRLICWNFLPDLGSFLVHPWWHSMTAAYI
jgi:hypothetical protein